MASPDRDVVAFDLMSTTTTATNGFVDTPERIVNGGDGGGGDSLICDNNNNELSKLVVGCSGMAESLAGSESFHLNGSTPLLHSTKEHASGDQSIDSGVAGGDSDEADCGAVTTTPSPPPPAMQPPIKTPPSRPTSSSSGSSSLLGSGDEFKERSPLQMSPAEEMLQDQFFMNGIDKAIHDDDDDDDESNSVLGGSLEGNSLQHGNGISQDCKICQ